MMMYLSFAKRFFFCSFKHSKLQNMNYRKIFNFLAFVTSLGVSAWLISDFFGVLILYLIMYRMIIIPIVILYVISFIETIFSTIRKGYKMNQFKLTSHLIALLVLGVVVIKNVDFYKSKSIMNATLHDDLFHYTLTLRENGACEINWIGMFGVTGHHSGAYYMKGDTIIFTEVPYENDFIPDTLYLNRKKDAIFIEKDKTGNFSSEKSFLNHFEINEQ